MPDFITLLAVYYLCSNEAESRHLSYEEASTCAAVYHRIKEQFLPPTDSDSIEVSEMVTRNRAAYLSFKRWEEAHQYIVCPLMAQARNTPDECSAEAG